MMIGEHPAGPDMLVSQLNDMRIAYITPYQGPSLVKQRPIVGNRSMSNKVKIELIARALHARRHSVEVISWGEAGENKCRFYPAFSEPERFHPDIPVHYASALPVRRVTGLWSCWRTLQLFKARHQASPFDLVIIFNLKPPLIACANYAMRRLRLPVILEYEDDEFVDVGGETESGALARRRQSACARVLKAVAGGIAVSPFLLSRFPAETPKLMLRGVVGSDVLEAGSRTNGYKRNQVLFSGTHIESNGVAELIEAWKLAAIPGWELHITGYGHLTDQLREKAKEVQEVVFHGLVSREELVRSMCSAKICANPHAVSRVPGNVFAFKIIEYLAAGAHVISTPMGTLEPELERGMTYMRDNKPETIATTLKHVIESRSYERTAAQKARDAYGPETVSKALDQLIQQVMNGRNRKLEIEN
jgi:glycosyltransferase involved in cell wall biosynthesis